MRFRERDGVRTRIITTGEHLRLPRYLQGRRGIVERALGDFPFPGERANGNPNARREMLYTVCFSRADVFGIREAGSIRADLFESYLEPV